MSKRSTRNRNTITLDRREIARMIEAEVARRYTPPAGANVTPITQDIINQMYANLAPQGKTQGMFTPGAPIRPVEGITPAQGPRQWQYPIGYNIGQLPRSTEMTSFHTLRNLASLYDGIGMCEQVWFDLCSRPELVIKPRDRLTKDDNGDPIPPAKLEAIYGDRIAKWEAFFAKPDKRRSLKQWMRMMLKERLEIDAVSIFKHKDRSGGLYALEILDGSTIKPLLDERGMAPSPPYPAYQQFVYGVPGMLILNSDLIYRREVERTDSPYGFSRVEKIILRVNQALRKQNKDLAFFTDGNVPVGFLAPPDDGTTDWTPEQLLMYQTMWDGMLAGNDAIKARIKAIPPGSVYTKTDPDDIMTPFDEFLLRITCGDFGVPMTEVSFTEQSNRSTGETQEAALYRRTMETTMDDTSEMFTDVMVDEGETELEAGWKAFEEPEDLKTKAEAWNILIANGTQSTSQAATAMGLKPMLQTSPFVITKDGPVFIEDVMALREQTMQAKKAGLQMSIDNPGGIQQNEQGTQQGQQGAQSQMAGKQSTSGGGKQGNGNGAGKQGQNDSSDATTSAKRSLEPALPGQSNDAERAAGGIDAQATQVQTEADSRQSAQGTSALLPHAQGKDSQRNSEADALLRSEYRRWRECAIKDVKNGNPVRRFESSLITGDEYQRISQSLATATSGDDVRAVFRAKQPSTWEPPDVEDQLGILQRAEVATVTWQDAPGACSEICLENAGVTVRLGERFPGGQRVVVGHPHCQCQPIYRKADGTQISVSTGQEVEF